MLVKKVGSMIARIQNRLFRYRLHKILSTRTLLKDAPFPISLYRTLLERIRRKRNSQICTFIDTSCTATSNRVFFRHDIDTRACIEKMNLLLDLDLEYTVQSGVYFRADGIEYSLNNYRDQIERYRQSDLEIGLHTVCYTQDDYMSEFCRETDAFEKALGFRPTSFTVHGLGKYCIDRRLRFYEEIANSLQYYGYTFTDCHLKWRTYDYVAHDSHWNKERENRYLLNDFIDIPLPYKCTRPFNVLFLTHPCYWTE